MATGTLNLLPVRVPTRLLTDGQRKVKEEGEKERNAAFFHSVSNQKIASHPDTQQIACASWPQCHQKSRGNILNPDVRRLRTSSHALCVRAAVRVCSLSLCSYLVPSPCRLEVDVVTRHSIGPRGRLCSAFVSRVLHTESGQEGLLMWRCPGT